MIGPTAEHADIARAVGYEWTPEGMETLYLRSRILLACREAGHPPADRAVGAHRGPRRARGLRRRAAGSWASAA